ncbi:hypothetical protein [Cohnella terricola]|uniref:Nudix hydrolase domain-containing protein n=1 Tax=Cohnella terricola TaxID=1289167 RepID=A0A559JNF7_9BACL|nr:hypothetical protein [Cohnella terricola]TVY01412.1 hypothetical protein FPZ45_09760 [Cohnella terricola]
MGKMDEIIIVVPRAKAFADETLAFQGVESDPAKTASILANIEANYTTMRRGDAEENAAYKQPIPYCVIRRGDKIFLYKRLAGGGEARLHDKLSIGAGGHMNDDPKFGKFEELLWDNLNRELEEELKIDATDRSLTTIGFINDDGNEVGKVHIGILVILDIDPGASVEVRENDQLAGEWVSISQLLEEDIFARLETWSQITARVLA